MEKKKHINLRLKDKESKILDNYTLKTGLSKPELIRKCMLYCWKEMIDVSKVKLPSDKEEKQ